MLCKSKWKGVEGEIKLDSTVRYARVKTLVQCKRERELCSARVNGKGWRERLRWIPLSGM